MWDICLLKSLGEVWVFRSVIVMLTLVIGHQLLPTTLKIFIHIDHVHTAQTLIIVQVIVHPWDNFLIFHMSRWTSISPV